MIKKIKCFSRSLFAGFLMFCFMLINSVAVYAVPSLTASVDKASIVEGDKVAVSVSIHNNPQISTLGMALNYDNSILQYQSSFWSGNFSESDMTMASDMGDAVNLSAVCDESYSADGTIVTVYFLVSRDAEAVPVSLVLRDMSDAGQSDISDCSVTGTVKVPETVHSQTEEVLDVNDANEQEIGSEQKINTSNTDAGYAQLISVQHTADAPRPVTDSFKVDENYKTGAGIGSDLLLMAAVACGVLALFLGIKKRKGERE